MLVRPLPAARQCMATRVYSTAGSLDKKWLKRWDTHPARKARDLSQAEKYYALAQFPYPSGSLHIGHLRVYTISDVIARYRRMKGYNVVHAMGWDAFGLPAENAAVERGADPKEWTLSNIESMKKQMNAMLADFDWEREVVSCSPEYYKWTQKLFLMMHEKGLAYRKEAIVNWDPVEQTVLANEQVDEEGRSWRSGAIVEKKKLNQWFLGITKYAPELLEDLQLLDEWPDKVKAMQKNWIGQSKGARLTLLAEDGSHNIDTFTTRPDTLYGIQYVALSLDHPIVEKFAKDSDDLAQFVADSRELPEDSKVGKLLPLKVASPLNPTAHNIPVFVAPYVISDYGHGAVIGCPGHDTRDNAFWTENMPLSEVIKPIDPPADVQIGINEIYTGKDGTMNHLCGKYAGMSSIEGGKKIVQDLAPLTEPATQLRLRDWLISRQRFWGAPIPMVHCNSCGIVPVPDEQLPVLLPEGISTPLAVNEHYLKTDCPTCGGPAKRDSDTMDTFMDSSWYFFRYTDAQNKEKIFDHTAASALLPVDIYVGGVEHAILHLLYARFVSKFLRDYGAWDGGNLNGEPFKRLLTQGMVHGETFTDPDSGRFLLPHEVNRSTGKMVDGRTATVSYEKMSKSKYNGADPSECIAKHGADATRAHILFQAPPSEILNWDEGKIVGIERWLKRIESIIDSVSSSPSSDSIVYSDLEGKDLELWAELQQKIKSITAALHESMSFNTLISDYMKLARSIQDSIDDGISPAVAFVAASTLVKLIAPVVPAHAEEFWERLSIAQKRAWTSVFSQSWPEYEKKPETNILKYGVIINGKRRFEIEAEKGTADERLVSLATTQGQKWLTDKKVQKIIVPKGKCIISIIAK